MDKPSLLYYYAHIFLKHIIFNMWDDFNKIINQGPNALKNMLIGEFERIKQDPKNLLSNKEITIEPDSFNPIMVKIDEERKLLVVKFPTPIETAEVAYVAILLNAENPRYFTLELHRPNEMEKQMFPDRTYDRYEFCEWSKDGKHHILGTKNGELKSPNPDIFIEEIKAIL
jgi:hypothetical protein